MAGRDLVGWWCRACPYDGSEQAGLVHVRGDGCDELAGARCGDELLVAPLAAARAGVRRAPFLPTQLTSLGLWLDAAQVTGAADGAAIPTWQDRSGNGRDATQGTVAKQPIYRSTGALVTPSGRPVLQFDGVSSNYLSTCPQVQDLTFFAVAYCSSTTNYKSFIGSPLDGGIEIRIDQTTNAVFVLKQGVTAGSAASSVAYTIGAHQQATVTSATGGTSAYFVNGATAGTSSGLGAFVATTVNIGSGGSAGGAEFFNGGMAELIRYDRVLSAVERQQVEAYLKAKHGTP